KDAARPRIDPLGVITGKQIGEIGHCCSLLFSRTWLLLPLHGLPADIAPAEALFPFDPIHRRIGAALRLACGVAQRAAVEYAAAIGENGAVFFDRTGVKDLDVFDL